MLCYILCSCSDVARELLDADPSTLESTTRKIRHLCYQELQLAAVSGCMLSDGRLRACLIMAASLIRLDIQELEGLNSMIKLAVARSKNNRLTLQLLTSRVCTRKIVSLYTAGAIKYKAIIPAAAALAKSAFLYHGAHRELLDDTERWQPCTEAKMVGGDPHVYDPALAHTPEQIWAAKYNKMFMRQVRAHEKNSRLSRDTVFALLLPPAQQHLPPDVWIVICVTRSQAMMLQASRSRDRDGTFSLDGKEHDFVFSTSLLASLSERVAEAAKSDTRSRLKLHSQVLQVLEPESLQSATVSFQLHGEPKPVAELRARYARKTAEEEPEHPLEDNDSQLEELDDGDDDEEGEDDLPAGDASPEADNEALMRALHGWDDGDSGDDKCDEGGGTDCCSDVDIDDDQDDVAELDDLNIKLLAAATSQQSEAEAAQLNAKVEHVAEASATSCALSPVDAETEALLQEFLLSAQHMHEHTAAQPSSDPSASSSDPAPVSADPQQRLGTVSSFAVSKRSSARFCESWKLASADSVAALIHRHENSSRSLGDDRHLDAMMRCKFEEVCGKFASSSSHLRQIVIRPDCMNGMLCMLTVYSLS